SGQPIIVIGGSSSVEQWFVPSIFIAKLSGFSPITTTASLHNSALLKSHGATHVLDRNLLFTTISDEISKIAPSPINLVFIAVSLPN
ncbi:hypothetical protein BJ138DRAFT_991710, partial [Hygrophoropsis aurantiaca]